jgi:hypothetical protein
VKTDAPMLIREYATAASATDRESIVITLTTLNQVVSVGFWQILEGIPAAVWLVGIGACLYRAGQRLLSLVPFVLGVFLLLFAIIRVLGF